MQILNYMLCRGDLNNQQLEIKPVSLWGLVSSFLINKLTN